MMMMMMMMIIIIIIIITSMENTGKFSARFCPVHKWIWFTEGPAYCSPLRVPTSCYTSLQNKHIRMEKYRHKGARSPRHTFRRLVPYKEQKQRPGSDKKTEPGRWGGVTAAHGVAAALEVQQMNTSKRDTSEECRFTVTGANVVMKM